MQSNVTLIGNTAGDVGGGMFSSESTTTLFNAYFSNNTSETFGGGMYNINSHSSLTNITFSDNSAQQRGGGIYNNVSNPLLTNITLSGNSAEYGGGIYNSENSNPTLRNATFFGNTALESGGGIYNSYSNPDLTNSIIWSNSPDSIAGDSSIVTYSIIQGGHGGIGNIDIDPRLGNFAEDNIFMPMYPLLSDSPAIDAGNPDLSQCPETDQRGIQRPQDGDGNGTRICDMGSYEYENVTYFWSYLPLIVK